MANALKLTPSQATALRMIAEGTNPFVLFGRRRPNCGTRATYLALERRGLVIPVREGDITITPAGRAALLRATGKNAPPKVTSGVILPPQSYDDHGRCVVCAEDDGHDLIAHAIDDITKAAESLPPLLRTRVRRALGLE